MGLCGFYIILFYSCCDSSVCRKDQMNFSIENSIKGQVFLLLISVAVISTFWKVNMTVLIDYDSEDRICGCETCIPDNNTWFLERFNQSIQPLLTSFHNISLEEFNWWKVRHLHLGLFQVELLQTLFYKSNVLILHLGFIFFITIFHCFNVCQVNFAGGGL